MSDPCSVTILRTQGRLRMAKAYEISSKGPVTRSNYSNAKHFSVTERTLGGIGDLHRFLVELEAQPQSCVIRGEPIEGTNLSHTTRALQKNGGQFVDVPRQWLLVDMDDIPAPPGFDILAEPKDAAQRLLDVLTSYIPELAGVSAVVRHSSGAGLGELAEAEAVAGLPRRWDGIVPPGSPATVSAHCWFWLAEPLDGEAVKRWAKAINAEAGFKLVDPALSGAVQAHYCAAPVFGPGLRDPLAGRRTLYIEGEADAATLTIPAEAPRAPWKPGQQASSSLGYTGWLDAIGGADGFNGPIMRAVSAFVAANFPAPDLDALVADVSARVLAANPGGRGPDEIRRYASDAFIRDKAEWAVARETRSRAERAAVAAASAAQPVAPTYPNRTVPLAEAGGAMRKVMTGFATRIGQGEAPHILVNVTVGGGKSYAGIEGLPLLVDVGKAAGLGPVLFL
ncbi:hypothetical protein, partial [Belnapia moabensis]|uniref:hypothetical protein n=1 Tax=Belnapia moabensis TaxID=365533 RepID=UPI0005B78C7D